MRRKFIKFFALFFCMKEGVYTEVETEAFLTRFVPVAPHVLTKSIFDGEKAARKIGFPLVLKIISPDAIHKSEVHGVRLVKNHIDFAHEYKELEEIARKKKLHLEGILVQEFIRGKSLILGLKKDAVFGHVLVFGIGGIYTELLRDVSFRVCPITEKDAEEMIGELKMHAILSGFRGSHAVDAAVLKKTMVAVSRIPSKHPEIQEMDINPFVIYDKKGFVVDARMRV